MNSAVVIFLLSSASTSCINNLSTSVTLVASKDGKELISNPTVATPAVVDTSIPSKSADVAATTDVTPPAGIAQLLSPLKN